MRKISGNFQINAMKIGRIMDFLIYEGVLKSTRTNKENSKNLGKDTYTSQRILRLAPYSFSSHIQ